MRTTRILFATLAAAAVASFGPAVAPASAAPVSASIVGDVATLNLDDSDNTETVSVDQGLLVHSGVGGALKSTADWDSTADGEQTVPADGTHVIVVNGGSGNDTISILASVNDIVFAEMNGNGGDDVLTDADTGDQLNGGDGNDRLVGGKGGDDLQGGAGDDTFVWNNGDGSDVIEGDAGDDTVQVNGSTILGDTFTLAPENGRVRFKRTNLNTFSLLSAAEHFQVNGLGGDDFVEASPGVGALTQLSVDGGSGGDVIRGSDGPDLLVGGPGNDRITGGAGRDAVFGGGGDDQVDVSGDGPDFASGGDGTDLVFADAADVDLIDGFETINRPASPPAAPPPAPVEPPPTTVAPPAITPQPSPAPAAKALAVTIKARTAKVTRGSVGLRISCPAGSPANCTGVLVLRTRAGKTLGRSRYHLAPGASVTLKVKLARNVRRLAGRKGRLSAVAVASTNGNTAPTSRTVTLTIAR
jgi:hypothetical protein